MICLQVRRDACLVVIVIQVRGEGFCRIVLLLHDQLPVPDISLPKLFGMTLFCEYR